MLFSKHLDVWWYYVLLRLEHVSFDWQPVKTEDFMPQESKGMHIEYLILKWHGHGCDVGIYQVKF